MQYIRKVGHNVTIFLILWINLLNITQFENKLYDCVEQNVFYNLPSYTGVPSLF